MNSREPPHIQTCNAQRQRNDIPVTGTYSGALLKHAPTLSSFLSQTREGSRRREECVSRNILTIFSGMLPSKVHAVGHHKSTDGAIYGLLEVVELLFSDASRRKACQGSIECSTLWNR